MKTVFVRTEDHHEKELSRRLLFLNMFSCNDLHFGNELRKTENISHFFVAKINNKHLFDMCSMKSLRKFFQDFFKLYFEAVEKINLPPLTEVSVM